MIALAALAAANIASAATAPLPGPQQLEFKGAALGMPLSAWRAAPFPGQGRRQPVCASDPDAGAAGIVTSPGERQDGDLVCTYAYAGQDGPRTYVPIDNGLMARRVRYVFRDGRLIAVGYRTSPDAFDAIVARVDAQIGHDRTVVRDQARLRDGAVVPRVRMRWTGPAGVVVLIDPIATGRMAVLLATPTYAQRHPLGT